MPTLRPFSVAVCIALAMPIAPAVAQPAARGLTAADVFQLEYAGDPQISPDGQWIVYVRRFSDIQTDRRYGNLWLLKTDGSVHRPITSGRTHDDTPRWSPDGKRLAYISDKGGTPQLHVRYMDTGESFAITSVPTPPVNPAWSADGTQIAYVALAPEPALVIGKPLTPPPGATWSAPPKYTDKFAFRFNDAGEVPSGWMHAFVVRADGGAPRQVTSGAYHHAGLPYAPGTVSWTPDGTELLLSARRIDDWEIKTTETDLWAVNVASGAMRRLTERVGPDQNPVVSPDGKLIAYTGYDDRHVGYQNTMLYVMNRDGSGKRLVSGKIDQSVGRPIWAADSKGVYVQFDEKGNTRVAHVALDGTVRVVAKNLGSGTSAYSGGEYSVSQGGTVAFTLSTPSVPSEVAISTPGPQGATKTLTTLNASLLANRQLGKVEEIWYKSSKDQRPVQGWIITPPGFDPAKKYPFILEIHGGPFANYGDRFDEEKQVMAANGFVVLYTNPRGSTSYGEEFGNLIHQAYPGDDFYDLNSGVDAVIAKGYVDPAQLYVTGGSGGGVLTAWMIGHTDRFKAALAFYPVINWESFVLTADMGAKAAADWMPGLPWDNVDNYAKRSLLSVVKNVKTPTLIMTGEEDFRTPMSESEQYYKALKLRGVETVLVRVPDEPHGIRRRPSHEAAKLTTLQGWFEKHRGVTP
ncbi:MAG: S9 family peptidase [Gemmatimonadetes bacterium]|nr:S9 family peptidase [Gemmatimonadota bacterium]